MLSLKGEQVRTKKIKVLGLSLVTALAINAMAAQEKSKDSQSLGSVDVISTETTLNQDTYTVESMNTSTKLDLSLRETPQSVTVLTQQKLEDLGITSYDEMLSYVTGITLNRWDERLNSSARGFVVDYYKVDGIPTYTEYNDREIDLSIFERVEVVRGANGLTTGEGNPALGINLVRKRAHSKELQGNVTAQIGSWNSYSVGTDVGSALNDSGSLRGRVVLKHEDADSFMDGYEKQSNLVYAVLDADVSDSTYLSVGASYQKIEKDGVRWGGLPAFYSDGSRTDFDRSKTVSDDWTYWDNEIKTIFANLEQTLYKDISLNVAYTYDQLRTDTALLYFKGQVNKADGSGLQYMDWQASQQSSEHNLDVNVNFPFEINGLAQEIMVGSSYSRSKQDFYNGRYPGGYYTALGNFFSYDLSLPAASGSDVLYVVKPEVTEQKAAYVAGKFSLHEDLKLITGARMSYWKYTSEDSTKDTRKFNGELTPYVGLVYDLDENHSIYTSYTSIFKTQDKQNVAGDYLDPIVGNSYEAGIKGEYFDGKLMTSLSVFRIEQDNVAEQDGTNKVSTNPSKDAYVAAEGVTSQGFEFDISGQVTDNFSVDFGVANFEAKDAAGAQFNTKASRTTSNLFAKYKIEDFVVGGGLQYKSKFYTGTGSSKITQDAYTLANVMFGYNIDKQTKLQLNVSNLFDKKYYDGIGDNSMVYGEPRKAMISLKYTF